ncbi:MAG: vitamin B12 dependent-methionine synthase activation domain-containing protein [Oscillospiraceae bacterium]|nr:vitamin B12 dependent-methionine synthase activation domain-containing protein [Oscillospiraceae bacterium]
MELSTINKAEAVRYLRYGDNIPDKTISLIIDECERRLLDIINPMYVYRVFDKEYNSEGELQVPGYNTVLKGKSIKKHLENSQKIAMLCATLSNGADTLIRTSQVNDVTGALITDALANAAIEQVCDHVCDLIKEKLPDYYQTSRFSPGYGDLPMDLQNSFLTILDAPRRIGVTLSDGGLLVPLKSVTAIVGLTRENIKSTQSGCSSCALRETCEYRKSGTNCRK